MRRSKSVLKMESVSMLVLHLLVLSIEKSCACISDCCRVMLAVSGSACATCEAVQQWRSSRRLEHTKAVVLSQSLAAANKEEVSMSPI